MSAEPKLAGPKLACEGVWKLFGPDPETFLQAHGPVPTPAQLAEEPG